MSTIEITNDQQAEAARNTIELFGSCMSGVVREEFIAALAAYEERKAVKDIVLSEDAMIVLQQKNIFNDFPRYRQACTELRDNSLITRNASEVINDAGRAYLAQKPKLKWEVHCKCGKCDSFRGAFDNEEIANQFLNAITSPSSLWDGEYEVREVR